LNFRRNHSPTEKFRSIRGVVCESHAEICEVSECDSEVALTHVMLPMYEIKMCNAVPDNCSSILTRLSRNINTWKDSASRARSIQHH
jgi:hypothetical protein